MRQPVPIPEMMPHTPADQAAEHPPVHTTAHRQGVYVRFAEAIPELLQKIHHQEHVLFQHNRHPILRTTIMKVHQEAAAVAAEIVPTIITQTRVQIRLTTAATIILQAVVHRLLQAAAPTVADALPAVAVAVVIPEAVAAEVEAVLPAEVVAGKKKSY